MLQRAVRWALKGEEEEARVWDLECQRRETVAR
jgi:hypothetical protein